MSTVRHSSRARTQTELYNAPPTPVHHRTPSATTKRKRSTSRSPSTKKAAASRSRSPSTKKPRGEKSERMSELGRKGAASKKASSKKKASSTKKRAREASVTPSPSRSRSPASKRSASSKKKSASAKKSTASSKKKKATSTTSSNRSEAAKKAAATKRKRSGTMRGGVPHAKNPRIEAIPNEATSADAEHHTPQHNPKTEAKRMAHLTNKEKRQAEHIEQGYEEKGMGEKKAKAIAYATVNKLRAKHGETKTSSE